MNTRVLGLAGLLLAAATLRAAGEPPAAGQPGARTVFVPYPEYARLEAAARGAPGPGVRGHLTAASFAATLDGAAVRLGGRFHFVRPPGAESGELTLMGGRAAVVRAPEGDPAVLVRAGKSAAEGAAFVLGPGAPGEGSIEVEWLLPITTVAGARCFSFVPPPAAVCSLEMAVSASAPAASLEPAPEPSERRGTNGVRWAMLPGIPARASWLATGAQTAEADGAAQVTVLRQTTRYLAGPGELTGSSRFELEATGAPLASLVFTLTGATARRVDPGVLRLAPPHETAGVTATIAFADPLLGREQLSLEFRQAIAPDGGVVLSPPRIAGARPPRDSWVALQSHEPLEVAIAGQPSTAVALVGPAETPPDLLPARGLTTRLAARLEPSQLNLPVRISRWTAARRPDAAAALVEEFSATTIVADDRISTQCKLSVAASRGCTLSLAWTGETSAALEKVTVDGWVDESSGARGPTRRIDLARSAAGLATPVQFDAVRERGGGLGLAGTLTLTLPEPSLLVRSTAWRIFLPREYVAIAVNSPLEGATPRGRSMPFRFGAEVAETFGSALIWVGLPGIALGILALGLRRTPIGDQAVPAALGVAILLMLLVTLGGFYTVAAPMVRELSSSRPGELPGQRAAHDLAAPGGGDAAPRSGAGEGALASAGPTQTSLDDGGGRMASAAAAGRDGLARPTVTFDAPARGFAGESVPNAGMTGGESASAAPAAEGILLSRGAWLPAAAAQAQPAASSSAAAPVTAVAAAVPREVARVRLEASVRYVQRGLVPVLQGLSVVFGFALFLLSSLFWTDARSRRTHAALLGLALLFVTGAEAMLPPGRGYGAQSFAIPLVLLTVYRVVRWMLSPHLREELGRTLGQAAAFGVSSSTEVPISELFPDSDGIDFVAEKPAAAGPAAGRD